MQHTLDGVHDKNASIVEDKRRLVEYIPANHRVLLSRLVLFWSPAVGWSSRSHCSGKSPGCLQTLPRNCVVNMELGGPAYEWDWGVVKDYAQGGLNGG